MPIDILNSAADICLLRGGDEITSPFVHLIFRPYLPDLQTQNPQNSSTIPAVLRFQIEQIQPKSERQLEESYFVPAPYTHYKEVLDES